MELASNDIYAYSERCLFISRNRRDCCVVVVVGRGGGGRLDVIFQDMRQKWRGGDLSVKESLSFCHSQSSPANQSSVDPITPGA